jgi:hypothetical protein
MPTINGKLITQGQNHLETLDTLKHQTTNIMQNFQDLETQIINLSQQQEQKYAQEINTIKSRLTQLDKRCILLEESIARQLIQVIFINICSIFGLIFMWYWFEVSNKPTHQTKSVIPDITINLKSRVF